jgi:hypothetical protein
VKTYYEKNKEKIREQQKARYEKEMADPERRKKRLEKSKLWKNKKRKELHLKRMEDPEYRKKYNRMKRERADPALREKGKKERGKKYREKNKEKINERSRKYKAENKEKICKKARERYHKDIEKTRARQNSYRLKNPEQYREREQKYREQNREKILEINNRYKERKGAENMKAYWANRYREKFEEIALKTKEYSKDPEVKKRKKAYSLEYYKKNRHRYRALSKKSKMRRKNALLPSTDSEAVREIYYQREKISEETGVLHHVDHIIPLAIGGAHHQDNLRVITGKENLEKGFRYNPKLGGVWADNELAKKHKKEYEKQKPIQLQNSLHKRIR